MFKISKVVTFPLKRFMIVLADFVLLGDKPWSISEDWEKMFCLYIDSQVKKKGCVLALFFELVF